MKNTLQNMHGERFEREFNGELFKINKLEQIKALLLCLCVTFLNISCLREPNVKTNRAGIWFDSPAQNWNEAIPIGNGTLGGMVYGGVESDTIKINEETLWSGGPRDLQNYEAIKHLPKIRQLLNDDKTKEAERLINSTMLGEYNECYMPMGDLVINTNSQEKAENYIRQLDLETGLVNINYSIGGVQYKKEVFSSYPDKVIVVKFTSSKKGQLNFSTSLTSLLNHQVSVDGNQVILKGNAPKHAYPHYLGEKPPVYEEGHGMRFQMNLLVRNKGGQVNKNNKELVVENADEVDLILTAATSFNGFDKNSVTQGKDYESISNQKISELRNVDYAELKENHISDYSELYSRVKLNLGESEAANLPINQRIKKYKPGTDPGLTTLYFNFGRYLLISSSRQAKHAQPAHLQGIWSRLLKPAWSANWTLNCNAQINYWGVEITNLSELHLPLIELTKELTVDGARTAKNMYGAGGWIAHHNADIWRTTSPVGGNGLWAIYQVGSAWLCHHLWEHYEFTLDKKYLTEVYPVLKGAAMFYMDNLQRDQDGFWVTNPSESFENHFRKPDGTIGWACVGATQDMQIIRDLFQNCRQAIRVLENDSEFDVKLEGYLKELLPMRISPTTGRLQEWKDDWESAYANSGQLAHGWGLAVGSQITPRGTPELAEAFIKTLEHRKPWEQNECGSWTGSFAAKFWARLENGEMLQKVFDNHFSWAVFPNLTSNFRGLWEIDGNLGIMASIAEMLLQSHSGEIVLLPALPRKYPTGEVKGLCARNGFEVDIKWEDNELTKAVIFSKQGENCKVRYKEKIIELDIKKGGSHSLFLDDYK
ncbi:glycoside hydrolase family 95 protein [uncultured Sunxiuqinia sp.]|uniref:glycoside hydrolase family 95 protein n=1 Tax=uncultured Sunxiuqinia sp. TaxID=1573825 RepID=UPI00263238BB|nr:glycoside hydrolase family 95 protein [uncultured Sunxiuqinia sp.]